MYNFSMLIAQHVKPKEKDLKYKLQINFTQAAKICLNFFRYKGKEPPYDIEATIQRFLLQPKTTASFCQYMCGFIQL